MNVNKDINLRTTFNKEAELYHAVRPRYPEELFDALVKTAQLWDDAKLLEIGLGTGQATEPLAKRGYEITAVELGSDLAEIARKALEKYKNIKIITGAIEDIELPPRSFELVYAATAFHWVTPEVKFNKPHKLLKTGGHLAIISTHLVSDEDGNEFFFASQPIYKKYKPGGEHDDNFRLSRTAELKADWMEENLFTSVFFNTFPLVVRYSAKEYVQLLNTYAPTILMKPDERAGFLREIKDLIEEKFGGSILKHYVMTLTIAKKKS